MCPTLCRRRARRGGRDRPTVVRAVGLTRKAVLLEVLNKRRPLCAAVCTGGPGDGYLASAAHSDRAVGASAGRVERMRVLLHASRVLEAGMAPFGRATWSDVGREDSESRTSDGPSQRGGVRRLRGVAKAKGVWDQDPAFLAAAHSANPRTHIYPLPLPPALFLVPPTVSSLPVLLPACPHSAVSLPPPAGARPRPTPRAVATTTPRHRSSAPRICLVALKTGPSHGAFLSNILRSGTRLGWPDQKADGFRLRGGNVRGKGGDDGGCSCSHRAACRGPPSQPTRRPSRPPSASQTLISVPPPAAHPPQGSPLSPLDRPSPSRPPSPPPPVPMAAVSGPSTARHPSPLKRQTKIASRSSSSSHPVVVSTGATRPLSRPGPDPSLPFFPSPRTRTTAMKTSPNSAPGSSRICLRVPTSRRSPPPCPPRPPRRWRTSSRTPSIEPVSTPPSPSPPSTSCNA